MAASVVQTQGYQCEFIDSVPEDFYCKKCTLVARRLSITTCCGESFCYSCIADTQEQGKPCPACGKREYYIVEHVKNQKRINCLRVYCSMKERGCGWSGTLDQLDTHLDPDQDKCQYVDTKCPLNCHMTIPKNKVKQHVAQHCAKRPYVCQYCSFKATYEEVVDTHLPECKRVPLRCPNLCGVTFERDFMVAHLRMCHLEEVGCEFSGVGCEERFRRKDKEEHTRQNSQKHLTLTASLAKQLQQKLKKHREEEWMLKKMMEDQEKKMEEQEKKMVEQEKTVEELKKVLKEEQEQKIKEQKKITYKFQELEETLQELRAKSDQNEAKHSNLTRRLGTTQTFEIENYSRDIKRQWRSPAMYTHTGGYKFFTHAHLTGSCANFLCIALFSVPGEFDGQLNWPVMAKFTIELVHQQRGENVVLQTDMKSWNKPTSEYKITSVSLLLWHSRLDGFLVNDTLHFCISNMELLF